MKCRNCGGEVGLEERFCPYCGTPNEQAIRHFQDMADYQDRYTKTEAHVVGAAKRYAQIIPRVIVILLLLIVTVVMAVIAENAYAFPDRMRHRAAQKDAAGTVAVLEAYLAQQEYISLASYMEFNDIRTFDTAFEDYSDIRWAAQSYKDVMLRMESLFLHQDREKWANRSATDDIRMLCQSLESFFETLERKSWDSSEPVHQAHLDRMRDDVMDLLRVYLGIEGEEAEDFLALSTNRKAAFLEEVLLDA